MRKPLIASVLCGLAVIAIGQMAPTARADEPKTAKDIERRFDRLKIDALADYVAKADRADAETAYMIIFNSVIEHDLFADFEKTADRYLKDRPDGAVTPLARAVKSMALANRGEHAAAAKSFAALVAEVTPQNARFAWSFAEALARQSTAAGDYAATKEVFTLVKKKFADDAALQAEIKSQLAKIELVGKPAPAIDATDLDGKTLRLADYRDKVVLIDFWATWCVPCVAEFPNVRAVYDKFHSRGFEVIGVSLDEEPATVREFLKDTPLPWRQVLNPGDPAKSITDRYGVTAIPATFLVDGDGKIQRIDLRGDNLEAAVAKLLNAKTAARSNPAKK